MAEPRDSSTQGESQPPVDSELDIRAILMFVGGLTSVVLVVFALMWGITVVTKRSLVKKDPAPPKLEEAREAHAPPKPNLQPDPAAELQEFRAAEETALSTWSWVDKEKGLARVPADRALEIVASRGLPPRPPMPPPEKAEKAAP